MEKVKKSNYDHKEYMRVAMLKHEETFREQVYELHRLYRVQKVLMQNAEFSQQKQEKFLVENKKAFKLDYSQSQRSMLANGTSKSNVTLLERPNEQVLCETVSRLHNVQENITESNRKNNTMMLDENELELTLSLGPTTTPNPRLRKFYSGHESLSSSSTGSSQTRTSLKNSSLSMGDQFTWSGSNFSQGAEVEPGFSNGQQNNPPWLFQALSLKLS